MRLAKDLVGKPVITISDGQVIGEVKDVCLTTDQTAIAGVFLGKKGLIKRKQRLIPASDVVLFGIDIVLVDSPEAVTDKKAHPEAKDWTLLNKAIGRNVKTTGGTQIGRVADVVFDEVGDVTALALSKIIVDGPIKASGVINYKSVVSSGGKKEPITVHMDLAERPLSELVFDDMPLMIEAPTETEEPKIIESVDPVLEDMTLVGINTVVTEEVVTEEIILTEESGVDGTTETIIELVDDSDKKSKS